ncbi:YopX family protein [Enterococcus larvae]|uniref:YopX family protein n=1 Tax=Enterococcus larvae TaxID=2794352 RepID=UPI003F2D1F9F
MKKMNLRAWDKRVQAMRRVTRIDFLDGLVYWVNKLRILREVKENVENVELMQSINQQDKNGRELFADDLVKLILPDGEVRIFRIRIKTVDREVRNHQEFVGEYSKVRITAVVFEWQGFDLFPCVDENGVSDVSNMEWVGTFWENPELLEVFR